MDMAKTRLQFDFSDESLGQLDELKGATGAPSRAEVIRQALRLLQWTIEQTQDEKATVLVEKNGRQREVIFPYFPSRSAVKAGVRTNG
jgi:metal-responsive CopG/Arc/MetJ family transcriptional regulator